MITHSLRAMRLQDRALGPWVGRQTRCAMCRQYTNMFIPHGGSKVCHFLCFSSAPLQVDLMASKITKQATDPWVCPLANKRFEGKELSITSAFFGTVPVFQRWQGGTYKTTTLGFHVFPRGVSCFPVFITIIQDSTCRI